MLFSMTITFDWRGMGGVSSAPAIGTAASASSAAVVNAALTLPAGTFNMNANLSIDSRAYRKRPCVPRACRSPAHRPRPGPVPVLALLARAGRRVALCGFNLEDEAAIELGDLRASWAADGIRRAFVKASRTKYLAFPVDLPEVFRKEDAVFEVLDYGAMSLEGQRESLIAHEFVAMEYEDRVFVVGQRVVTAAGCVEEFTPADNSSRFDSQLRRNRQAKAPVEGATHDRRTLTGFDRNAVKALALEVPAQEDYVIDVALDADGQPLIVELNSLLNSGLYASQPDLVTEALAARELSTSSQRISAHSAQ